MINTLHIFQKKYHLRIGYKSSSPVMEFSAGLALQYATQLANVPPAEQRPFYLSVPEKEHFTTHFACTILLHYLFEDYCNPRIMQLSLGDKVEIFGSVAKYTGIVAEQGKPHSRLLFASDTTYNAPESYRQHMVKADNRRTLNTIDHFKKKRKTYLKNNDLNSLFNLNDKEAVNPNGLNNKLYLVTGRGHVVSTREKLKNENCINQSLENVFKVGINLIVVPDLEEFAPIFNKSTDDENSYFVEELRRDLEELVDVYDSNIQVLDLINQLDRYLSTRDFSEIFSKLLKLLTESVEDPYRTRLLGLTDYMPVKEAGLPDNLKIVVLNSINLAADYAHTVSGLLTSGIPVIVLTDQLELISIPEGVVDILKNSYRFYWSREQVRKLVNTSNQEYCDGRFWKQCVRYASQKIIIQSYTDPVGDRLFNTFESNSAFARLNGFENLKIAYYQYLRPALYLLKNTPGSHQSLIKTVQEQVHFFSKEFENIEGQLPDDIASLIAQSLTELRCYNTNPKHLPDNQYVFIQQIDFPNCPQQQTAQSTPKKLQIHDLEKSESDTVVFTGYPYREWNGKYLSDAVFGRFIPLVTVLAWQAEAKRTTGYLLKRIRNAGFDDYLPKWIGSGISEWKVPYRQEQPDETNLIAQMGSTDDSASIFMTEPIQTEYSFEDVQNYISNFRFASISASVNYTSHYLVLVNVLYFHNGSYMLLPHGRGGRVHFISRYNEITGEITEASFHELSVGDVVVCFNMDRDIVRKLAREQLNEAYKHLDVWQNCLQSLLNVNDCQFTRLEQYLIQQKELLDLSSSSPTKTNILRWFYESDMLAPQTPNLYLILQASGLSKSATELIVNQIRVAKSLIINNRNQVSERIKYKIVNILRNSQMLKDDILLDVDDVSVAIQCGRITDKEKRTNLEVPYTFTKQFIRD